VIAESAEGKSRRNKSESVRVNGDPNLLLDQVKAVAKTRQKLHNEQKFKVWLRSSANLSGHTTNDTISRCRRVQTALGIRLDESVRNQKRFKILTSRINEFAKTQPLSADAQRSLAQNHRYAVRKYAAFSVGSRASRWPNKNEPRESWQ